MNNNKATDVYSNAQKAGQKFRSKNSADEYSGYLPNIEVLISNKETAQKVALGVKEIPIDQIVGTYTPSRCNSFSGNFMPLLNKHSELAVKWQSVYQHQINEGICDPIKVIEYMGDYFVVEGAKRVSVMKYLGAYSITADVVKILPGDDR